MDFKFRIQGRGTNSAECWQHYNEGVHRRRGEPHCFCKYCNVTVMHPNRLPTKPTTSLKRHFLKCKEYLRAQRGQSDGQLSSTLTQYWGQSAQNRRTEPLTKLMLEEEILKFVISANLPFSQVENEHFRKIISWIPVDKCPAQVPSRKVVQARLSSQSGISKGKSSKHSYWQLIKDYPGIGLLEYKNELQIFRYLLVTL